MTDAMAEVTTVADDEIVVHVSPPPGIHGAGAGAVRAVRRSGLHPDHAYDVEGLSVRTLPRPPGDRLAKPIWSMGTGALVAAPVQRLWRAIRMLPCRWGKSLAFRWESHFLGELSASRC